MIHRKLPGINIQAPWSRLLLEGKKTIETRTYPLPDKYRGRKLWLIETPGREGRFKARVIGVICFSESKKYLTKDAYYKDRHLHLIQPGAKEYSWTDAAQKYGWVVQSVEPIEAFAAPTPRGIIYATPFEIRTEASL